MAGRPRPDEAEVPLYTVVDGVHIAYATFGSGPSDVLLLTPGFLSVDSYLDEPRMVSALRRHELERFVAGLEPPGGEVS